MIRHRRRPFAQSRHAARRPSRRSRAGFSLIEIVVAMTILAVVLLSLSGLAATAAERATQNEMTLKRDAALQLEASKIGAMPFSSLSTMSTDPASFTNDGFSYTRHMTRTAGTNRYTIWLSILPAQDPSDSVYITFDRSDPPTGTPLCVGC